jgi:protein O-GlcNAc transferase
VNLVRKVPEQSLEARMTAVRALLSQRQFASAAALLRLCIDEGAGAWAWHQLGSAEYALGRHATAVEAFGRALELDPVAVDSLVARATALAVLGDPPGAEQDLNAALALQPRDIQALFNLAVLREGQARVDEARALYDRVLDQEPTHFSARLNRGAIALDAGDPETAMADFDRLAAGSEFTPQVHANRARALFALFRDDEALAAADAALRLDPRYERALLDRGLALASLGHLRDAERVLAPLRKPAHGDRLSPAAIRFSRLVLRQSVCDWSERDAAVALARMAIADERFSPAVGEPGMVFGALALPLAAEELFQVGERALRHARDEGARIASRLPAVASHAGGNRIRIGFFGAGLRTHPEAYLVRRLILDRDTDRFEHFVYALNPGDGSAVRSDIARSADRFLDVSTWTAEAIAAQARRDGLDIAVDLSGAYEGTKPEIFSARVAPVQAALIATPSTLGPALHDYRLSDPWTTPMSEQKNWAERLVLLPGVPFAFDDSLRPGPSGTRGEHGLPREGFVFSCMNQAVKLHPESFDIWMRLLGAVPGSVLWLLDHGKVATANLRREVAARGIAPERVIYAPRTPLPEHLGRLSHADLFLDTFWCNAHTTALDALWAGLPVLTLPGSTMASRLASAFLHELGLPDLVTSSAEHYEAMALMLAKDRTALPALRSRLAHLKTVSPLFKTAAKVRAVEDAFAELVRRHRAGLPPQTLALP